MNENNDEKFDWLIKLLIVGDSGVGKTNILLRSCDDKFLSYNLSTIGFLYIKKINSRLNLKKGVDFKKKVLDIDGKKIKLQIWDTAGQERFQTIALSYYKGAWGIILVFSIDNRKSFDNIGKWMKQISDNAAKDVIILLVGNKCDLEEKRVVSYDEAKQLAENYNIRFYETSAKDDINISEIFVKIASDIKTKIITDNMDNLDQSKSLYLNNVDYKNNFEGCTC